MSELVANGGDLLVATALMVRNVVFVVCLLLRQIAIRGLGVDADRTLEALKGDSRAILASRALVASNSGDHDTEVRDV